VTAQIKAKNKQVGDVWLKQPASDCLIVFVSWRNVHPQPTIWFAEPTRVHIQNGISIGSAVFARLANVTNT